MNYIERGLYRELLDECWDKGSIPNDVEHLADICSCPIDVMASAWQVLSKCFALTESGWVNEKLDSLRTTSDTLRVKRANAGKLGGIAKTQTIESKEKESNSQANAKQLPYSRAEQSRAEQIQSKENTLVPETEKTPSCPHQEIVAAYHEICKTMPKVKIWSEQRKKFLQARWREAEKHQSLEFWRRFFNYVNQSDFLRGADGTWQADLEWLIRPSNFIKVIEGKYHNNRSAQA